MLSAAVTAAAAMPDSLPVCRVKQGQLLGVCSTLSQLWWAQCAFVACMTKLNYRLPFSWLSVSSVKIFVYYIEWLLTVLLCCCVC